jgi:hypothetical protein
MAIDTGYYFRTNLSSTGAGGRPPISGRALACVVTERGVANELYNVGSLENYEKKFGKPKHPSAKELVHFLQEGGVAQIVPIYHYTDISTDSSPVGTKASVGSGTVTITAKEVGSGYNGVKVIITESQADAVNLVNISVTTPEGDNMPISNKPKVITSTVQDEFNEYFDMVNFGTGTLAIGTFTLSGGIRSGGTKATVTIGGIDFEAKNVGTAANGTVILIEEGTDVDTVKITATKGTFVESLDNIEEDLSVLVQNTINTTFTLFSVIDSMGTMTTGTGTLAGGTDDSDAVVVDDLIGSAGNKRGIYKLMEADQNSVLILNLFANSSFAAAAGTFTQISNTTYRRHLAATEVGMSVSQVENFMSDTTAKSPFTTYFTGGVRALDPLTNVRSSFAGVGKTAICIMRKNVQGIYLSAAQYQFSQVPSVSDTVVKFDNDEIQRLQAAGCNFLQNNEGVVRYRGAWSTAPDKTQPIANETIADMAIYLIRFLAQKWEFYANRPNNKQLRKNFFNEVNAEIERLKRIQGGLIASWSFDGDVEVENDASPNRLELNQGIWKPKMTVVAISGLRILDVSLDMSATALSVTNN